MVVGSAVSQPVSGDAPATVPPAVIALWDSGDKAVGDLQGRDLRVPGFVHNPQALLELLDLYMKELQEEVAS